MVGFFYLLFILEKMKVLGDVNKDFFNGVVTMENCGYLGF